MKIYNMMLDMSCQWNFAWNDNETIQAYEAWEDGSSSFLTPSEAR